MSGRVLSSDPIARTGELWHAESDGGVVLETRQDVEPLIEFATEMRNTRGGYRGESMHHAGYIPQFQVDAWMRKRIPITGKLCGKWLDDHPAFKTHPGRLSK